MKIEYVVGDLMKAPELFAAQGCNAQGAMNSGVAKLYRDHDENIFKVYHDMWKTSGLKLGQIVPVSTVHPAIADERLVLFNAITQQYYGREPNHRYASYDGIDRAFHAIDEFLAEFMKAVEETFEEETRMACPRVAMPLIGAGLAQGRWPIIASIIEDNAKVFVPVVYVQSQTALDEAIA